MKRKANAIWKGSAKEGGGSLTGPSGVLDKTPYSFKARFENEDGKLGTNPEELIAAAHAGCFNMALSVALGEEGFKPDELNTDATVKLEKTDEGFAITLIELNLSAQVPEIGESKFKELANGAKEGCPISKALKSVPMELKIDFKN
jgi:osmotically inducible protein OsmC